MLSQPCGNVQRALAAPPGLGYSLSPMPDASAKLRITTHP
jgi:hypothetical protein